MSDVYLLGGQQAILTPGDVDAKWISDPGKPQALYFLNLAFKFYYDAYNAVEAAGGDEVMRRSLRKAVNTGNFTVVTGWGRVDKLSEGFAHLEKNGGRWKDEQTWNYYGGAGKIGGVFSYQEIPLCAANFLDAVNAAMGDLRDHLDGFAEGLGKLKEVPDDSNWKKVGEGLEAVKKYGGRAKPLLWVAPEALSHAGEVLLKWDESIDKVYEVATNIMTVAASNNPKRDAICLALSKVLSYAPMIGGFYGQIVAEIPSMAEHWTEFMDSYWARRGTTRYSKEAGWYR